ncbi:hypothetical protein F4818DRAFT_453407 [Hypoxylon cercidicola]|nr:hypothetical protein F4818DRAFT_453407 [Hypoxylon cercidicola]
MQVPHRSEFFNQIASSDLSYTFSMGTNLNSTHQAMATSELLRNAFPKRVVTIDDLLEHKAEVSRPWSQTCWVPAAVYVRPSTAEEVAEVLKIVARTGSKFAIRATGHNPNPGFGGVDETGVVIDLRDLDSKSINSDGILCAGAGSTWGDVYSFLEERDLTAVGGRETAVGLAGFLLGGGLGPFPSLHGIGADGVRNFEVVLADGTIVNANTDTNENLFRALKGGGSNFGIVTRFDLVTYPLINIQYTINFYDPVDYKNIIKATIQVQEYMESDPKIGLFTNFRNDLIIVGMLYADCPAETPKAFDPFFKLTSLVNVMLPTTNGTISSLVKTLGQLHPPLPGKRAVATATTKVSSDLYADIYSMWRDSIKTLVAGVDLHFTIQPVTTSCVRAGEDSGGNTLGLQDVPQCWFVFTAEWTSDTVSDGDDTAIQETLVAIAEQAEKLAVEGELSLSYRSMTFAHSSQNVLRSYGTDNVKRLQDTAIEYDPKRLFQDQQNNGFLLRNV